MGSQGNLQLVAQGEVFEDQFGVGSKERADHAKDELEEFDHRGRLAAGSTVALPSAITASEGSPVFGFTFAPQQLGILSIIGLVIHDASTQLKFQTALVGIFPKDAHKELLKAPSGVKQHAGLLGIISVLGLIWSGTGLFASMEFAPHQIFGSKQTRHA